MKKLIYVALAFTPLLALAQDASGSASGLDKLVQNLKPLVNDLIALLIGVAIIFFFWGLVTYLRAGGDPKMQEQGKSHMLWGVIAIAIMVSIFGLVNWLQSTLGVSGTAKITPPQI